MFNLSESFKSKECRLRVRGTDFFFANSEQVFSMLPLLLTLRMS